MGAGIRADVKSKQIVCHFIATRIRREASCVPRRPWPLRTSNVNAMHAKPRTKKKRRRRRLKNKNIESSGSARSKMVCTKFHPAMKPIRGMMVVMSNDDSKCVCCCTVGVHTCPPCAKCARQRSRSASRLDSVTPANWRASCTDAFSTAASPRIPQCSVSTVKVAGNHARQAAPHT